MTDGTALGLPTQHTAADLRGILTVPTPQRHQHYVRTLAAAFSWDPSSSEVDNGVSVIQPTDRSSLGGRWVAAVGGCMWETINVTTIHRASPGAGELAAIPAAGLTIWTPLVPGFVRGLTCNDDSGDPLVGSGGGAYTLAIGTTQAAMLINATAIATFGTNLTGWGVNGPSVATNIIGTADGGVVVAPAGSIPGRASVARTLMAFAGGSGAPVLTGKIYTRFQFLPMGTWS